MFRPKENILEHFVPNKWPYRIGEKLLKLTYFIKALEECLSVSCFTNYQLNQMFPSLLYDPSKDKKMGRKKRKSVNQ